MRFLSKNVPKVAGIQVMMTTLYHYLVSVLEV